MEKRRIPAEKSISTVKADREKIGKKFEKKGWTYENEREIDDHDILQALKKGEHPEYISEVYSTPASRIRKVMKGQRVKQASTKEYEKQWWGKAKTINPKPTEAELKSIEKWMKEKEKDPEHGPYYNYKEQKKFKYSDMKDKKGIIEKQKKYYKKKAKAPAGPFYNK